MSDTEVGREVRWEELREDIGLGVFLSSHSLLSAGFMLVAWGVYALLTWQEFLRGPVGLILLAANAIIILVIVKDIRAGIIRRDTATQSIRAASQGLIELVGKVQSVGEPLVSPLYKVACIAYRSSFNADPQIFLHDVLDDKTSVDSVTFSEETIAPAFLLTDGMSKVFVPLESNNVSNNEMILSKDDEPLDTLRPDVAERLLPGMTVTSRDDVVVPVGIQVMVSGVFRTLSSDDSYVRTAARHCKIMEPSDDDLACDLVEQAWIAHCRRREAAEGSRPVRVDAVLPIGELGVPVVPAYEPAWRVAVKQTSMMLVVLIPSLYLMARLMDWTPPLAFLF